MTTTVNPAMETRDATKKPNLLRSCEACRASKSRCLPSPEPQGKCQKCSRSGRECIFVEAQSRSRRARQTKTRVAEMEKKIDGIVALLTAGTRPASASAEPTPPPGTVADDSIRSNDSSEKFSPAETLVDDLSPSALSPGSSSDFRRDVIQRGILTVSEAESLIRSFQAFETNFPFVLLPSNLSFEELRTQRPILLLSILATTSQANQRLSFLLERELRETLSVKVIFEAEKSLDLLQGLIVYLAWYHFHFHPDRQQIYQLVQLAIAMAVDLGLTKPPRKTKSKQTTIDLLEVADSEMTDRFEPVEDGEGMRAFVGCYYVSSCLSLALRRPNNLKFSSHVEECCEVLAESGRAPFDSFLKHYVRIQRLAEEVSSTFGYEESEGSYALGLSQLDYSHKTFQSKLHSLKESLPSQASSMVSIMSAFYHTKVYIHEIGLHVRDDPVYSDPSRSSVTQMNMLLGCLDAAKAFLDYHLSLPLIENRSGTIMQATRLTYTTIVLSKIAAGVNGLSLDVNTLQETANLGYYLDSLANRMGELVSRTPSGEEQKDMFWHFRYVFQKMKLRSEQLIKRVHATPALAKSVLSPPEAASYHDPDFQMQDDLSGELDLDYFLNSDPAFYASIMPGWPTSTQSYAIET